MGLPVPNDFRGSLGIPISTLAVLVSTWGQVVDGPLCAPDPVFHEEYVTLYHWASRFFSMLGLVTLLGSGASSNGLTYIQFVGKGGEEGDKKKGERDEVRTKLNKKI